MLIPLWLPVFIQVYVYITCESKYPKDPAKQITDFMINFSALQFIGGFMLAFVLTFLGKFKYKNRWFRFMEKLCYSSAICALLIVPVIVLIHALHAFIRSGAYNDSYFTGILWLYPLLSLSLWLGLYLYHRDKGESYLIEYKRCEEIFENITIDEYCKEIRN